MKKSITEINFTLIRDEWDFKKNSLNPFKVTLGSVKKAWWRYSEFGHEWEARIYHRIKGYKCKKCFHCKQSICNDYTKSLEFNYPKLSKECHPELNGNMKPKEVYVRSGKNIGGSALSPEHEWKATPDSRARGTGFPYCKRSFKNSFPELSIFFYIKEIFPDTIKRGLSLTKFSHLVKDLSKSINELFVFSK